MDFFTRGKINTRKSQHNNTYRITLNNSIINITLLRIKGIKRNNTSSKGNDTQTRKKIGKLEFLLSSLPIDSRTIRTTERYINDKNNRHTDRRKHINKHIKNMMTEQDKTIADLEVDLTNLQLKIDQLESRKGNCTF